ncbi:putative UDP-glucose 4-epimerase [Gonapodya prolifera JEL478]|uniref:Putative UDP-glucose 4-epimerase n=1 Tax=Gonapodya prolifera (strain JEL478) TaxID=1344416 RepID=A0A139ATY2_GONPJ|nr:putative UDP-glucose 4-epimerase [Gonapodya prolifera JEL478]|eukprot:KXS20206.1 putative UDP-glucose 4-epimerase [Gonapodya prolifera JEL478]
MRVAVTGGSGKIGCAVCSLLLSKGHHVVNLDLTPPTPGLGSARARFIKTDFSDYGQTIQALSSVDMWVEKPVDAVVHLAGIPAPGLVPNSVVFHNNFTATYNVFEACRVLGIRNIVWASSETVLGVMMNSPETLQPILPIDESVNLPQSAYSLSKYLGEKMAEQFARWDKDLKIVGLRFSNVMLEKDYKDFEAFQANPRARNWNLWGYIADKDAAQAVLLSLEKPLKGAHVFIVANADTVMRTPNSVLVKSLPGVKLRPGTGEHETLLSIEKARRVLGYNPPPSRWRGKL